MISHCFVELCCTFEAKHQSKLTISSICYFQIHLISLDHVKKLLLFFPFATFLFKKCYPKILFKNMIWI